MGKSAKGTNQRGHKKSNKHPPEKGQEASSLPSRDGEATGREKLLIGAASLTFFIGIWQSVFGHWNEPSTKVFFLVCAAFGALIWAEHRHSPVNSWGKALSLPLLVWILFAAAIGAWWKLSEKGQFTASWQPPPLPIGCKEVFFSLGDGNFHGQPISRFSGTNVCEPIAGLIDPPITIRIKDNRMFVEAKIPRPEFPTLIDPLVARGIEIGQIPPQWQKQQASNALEIVNEDLYPIYQILYPSPDHVVIKGVFLSDKATIVLNENGLSIQPPDFLSNIVSHIRSIRVLFKYPAWKYPSQFADDKTESRSN